MTLVAAIDYKKCMSTACVRCGARLSCDTKAIVKIDPDEPAAVEPSRCMGCADCLSQCPGQAITMIDS